MKPKRGAIKIPSVEIPIDISDAVSAYLEEVLKKEPPRLSFPAEWGDSDGRGGPPVDDILTIYAQFPLGENEDTNPEYEFHVGDMINSVIESHVNHATNKIDDTHGINVIKSFVSALKIEIEKLESCIKTAPENSPD